MLTFWKWLSLGLVLLSVKNLIHGESVLGTLFDFLLIGLSLYNFVRIVELQNSPGYIRYKDKQ